MAEVAGLALGVLGVAGLFKACIENFDIVVNAREFSEEFDLLCTELSLLRVRLVLWGETLGIVPCPEGAQVPYNKAIDRPDIRPAIEKSLSHLRLLLSKADVVTDRYELKEESAALQQSSKGLMIFRERFEAFKLSIRKNQKQKSAWKVTRWAIHDLDRFKSLVEKIKSLVDGLEGITSSLGVLERQQALLVKEVESISDAQSLRLLKEAASSRRSSSLRVVSDAASHRLSLFHASSLPVAESMSASGSSFYTAPSNPAQEASCILSISVENDCAGTQTGQEKRTSPSSSDIRDPATTLTQDSGQAWTTTSREGIPQHKRIMAHLLQKYGNTIQKPGFASGANAYGRAMAKVKDNDEHVWKQASPNLIYKASDNESTARRLFLELRTIREASVPFLSASPVGDSLDKILASIEGPPDTPYAGGIFWISVRIPANGSAPRLLFQTRIYHPNIDPAGRICADYQSWWNDQNLSKYMGFTSTCGAWFSSHGSNHFSLGALLTALCNLLANPDVDDPLVPEIAEIYVTDYERYCEAARLYTERYAHSPRPHDEEITFDGEEPEGNALLLRVGTLSMQSNTATSAPSLAATGFRVHHSALGERLVARDADQAPFPVSCHRMSKVIIHHVGFGDILPNIKIVLTLDGSEAVIENEQWNGTSDRPRVYPGVRLSRLGSLFVSEVMFDVVTPKPRLAISVYKFMPNVFDNSRFSAYPLVQAGLPPKPILAGLAYLPLPSRNIWGRFRLDMRFHPTTFGNDDFLVREYLLGPGEGPTPYSSEFGLHDEQSLTMGAKTAPTSRAKEPMRDVFVMKKCSGTLYKGTSKKTGRAYAMKAIAKRSLIGDAGSMPTLRFRRTIADSPFFTTLSSVYESGSAVYLALNYLCSGTLFAHLRDEYSSRTPHSIALLYAAEMTLALESLDQHGVDWELEPENVLLDSNGHLTLSDFGVAKTRGQAVTEYSAPETLSNSSPDSFISAHSPYFWWLGCFIFHVSLGTSPFHGMDKAGMTTKIATGAFRPEPKDMKRGHWIQSLVDSLLVIDPRARLGARDGGFEAVKRHGYFGKVTKEIWAAVAEKGIPPQVFQGLQLVSL